MNNKHRKTLEKIFQDPIKPIDWQKIEQLFLALGAEATEGRGSRVTFTLNNVAMGFHRPHPEKEVKKYQVVYVRNFLIEANIDLKKFEVNK